MRVNQLLSSDHNQAGDAFSASLVNPVVVNGIVIADRGQTIQGRVSEAKKAGRVSGTSRLGVELTDLSLVDGNQVPLHTSLVNRNGRTSEGRDAVGIGAATGVGAIIGAGAAGWHNQGEGAAIGAGAGAAAGIIGVLLTRGKPTYLTPEQVLTFRVENPIVISTDRAPQAFRYVGPGDYQSEQPRPYAPRSPAPYYGAGYPVYGPGWGPYYGYPYYLRTQHRNRLRRILWRPLGRPWTLPLTHSAGTRHVRVTVPASLNPPAPCCNTRAFLPPPPASRITPPFFPQ